jgi:hypothetical protein
MFNQEVITITDKSKSEVVAHAKLIREVNFGIHFEEYGPLQICDDEHSWQVKFYFARGDAKMPIDQFRL